MYGVVEKFVDLDVRSFFFFFFFPVCMEHDWQSIPFELSTNDCKIVSWMKRWSPMIRGDSRWSKQIQKIGILWDDVHYEEDCDVCHNGSYCYSLCGLWCGREFDVHGLIEIGPISESFQDGCRSRGSWKSHSWTGLARWVEEWLERLELGGSQEGKASGWTWVDTGNSSRSKVDDKVVTNTVSWEKLENWERFWVRKWRHWDPRDVTLGVTSAEHSLDTHNGSLWGYLITEMIFFFPTGRTVSNVSGHSNDLKTRDSTHTFRDTHEVS